MTERFKVKTSGEIWLRP